MKFDTFTRSFLETALLASNDESDDFGGDPLDKNYSINDFDPVCLAGLVRDCERFQLENEAHITSYACLKPDWLSQAGHDFWLTRCGHGCGFWDGDWTEPAATILTDTSKAFGNVYLCR